MSLGTETSRQSEERATWMIFESALSHIAKTLPSNAAARLQLVESSSLVIDAYQATARDKRGQDGGLLGAGGRWLA